MKFRQMRFNIYLLLPLVLAVLVCGCQTPEGEKKKLVSVFRVHLEAQPPTPGRSQAVPIYRQSPITIEVQNMFFLSEEQVKSAKVLDTIGGFAVQIQFDRTGRMLLEQYTGGNVGKHLAFFAAFGGKSGKPAPITRWLAAPLITSRITDGLLTFTPDATREEAELLVVGLENMAKKYQDKEME